MTIGDINNIFPISSLQSKQPSDNKSLTMQSKDNDLINVYWSLGRSTLGSPRAESKPADTRTRSGSNWGRRRNRRKNNKTVSNLKYTHKSHEHVTSAKITCENTCKQYYEKHTVKLPHSSHLGDRGKWPLKDSHYGKIWAKYGTVFFFRITTILSWMLFILA